MFESITLAALLISACVYLVLGLRLHRRLRSLGDMFPIARHRGAAVTTSVEFSASTSAATISLATVVLAIFELAPYMGGWLLWTAFTTALGIVAVRLAARRIYHKLVVYGSHLPSLHEFLGVEFASRPVCVIGAICTSLGFLGAFAVELSVGSRFLAGMIPEIPAWVAVIGLASIGLIYTAAGGFRIVIITDRFQMIAIWILIGALVAFYAYALFRSDAPSVMFRRIPPDYFNFSARDGLVPFLIGIFVINVPTFIADMSVWQRIASSPEQSAVKAGLIRSAFSVMISWSALVILACLVPMLTSSGEENPLISLLRFISQPLTFFSGLVLFLVVQGLYAANLSTSSTQLIAISHTVLIDLFSGGMAPATQDAFDHPRHLRASRLLILGAGVVSIIAVEGLRAVGFSIADLVFAIYGAQLGLCPPVLLALALPRERLRGLQNFAVAGISLGFLTGWGSAIVGRILHSGDLVFLSPAASLIVSAAILLIGIFVKRARNE